MYNLALKPTDIILGTQTGMAVTKIAKPYVNYAGELAKPAYYTGVLAVATAKTTVNATIQGMKTAGGVATGRKPNTGFI